MTKEKEMVNLYLKMENIKLGNGKIMQDMEKK